MFDYLFIGVRGAIEKSTSLSEIIESLASISLFVRVRWKMFYKARIFYHTIHYFPAPTTPPYIRPPYTPPHPHPWHISPRPNKF